MLVFAPFGRPEGRKLRLPTGETVESGPEKPWQPGLRTGVNPTRKGVGFAGQADCADDDVPVACAYAVWLANNVANHSMRSDRVCLQSVKRARERPAHSDCGGCVPS